MNWRWGLSLVGWLVACGARSTLDVETLGTSGEGAGGQGAAGSGGGAVTTGSGGSGGQPPRCEGLVWAGPPVGIGVAAATPAERPRLVATSPTTTVLLFEFATSGAGSSELFSVPITGAFGAWPPTSGEREVHLPLVAPVVTSAGAPGEVAFTTLEPGGGAPILGRLTPEQNGSSFVTLPFGGSPLALGGTTDERFLLASGPPNFLRLDVVSTVVSPPLIQPVGRVGCADRPLDAEIVEDVAGGFWIANTSDQPHDDCLEPDIPEPPRVVSLWRAELTELTPVASHEGEESFTEVDLAARDEVAWVGAADEANGYTLLRHGPGGDDVLSVAPSPAPAQYDLGAIFEEAVLARVMPTVPGDELRVSLLTPEGEVAALSLPPASVPPASGPAVLVDGGRALIAWADAIGTVWVGRADCVAP